MKLQLSKLEYKSLLFKILFYFKYYIMTNVNPTKIAIMIYLIMVVGILYIKPEFVMDSDGNLKEFGFQSHQTILPLWLVIGGLGFISYMITIIYFV